MNKLEQAARQVVDAWDLGEFNTRMDEAINAMREALEQLNCQCGDKCFPVFSGDIEYCETCGKPTALAEQVHTPYCKQAPMCKIPCGNSDCVEQAEQEPPKNQYNHKRIGWELERTAQGESYYGNALYVAMDLPFLNKREKDCLHRYMHGSETPNDRFVLQDIAMKVYSEPEAAPVRTKDLTVDEKVALADRLNLNGRIVVIDAVIAADREKNK